MFFERDNNGIVGKYENEILRIEGWGHNGLRVRSTRYPEFEKNNWALEYKEPDDVEIIIKEDVSIIRNGKIKAEITKFGQITFYKEDKEILDEYYRHFGGKTRHTPSLKLFAREFMPVTGGDYKVTMRFESRDDEKIFGMGQYQQPYLDLKGCSLELAQRNSQISVPFALSSLGYGFLWNNPGIGNVNFGKNITQWEMEITKEIDYWITADDTPKDILRNYTDVTGRAPEFPDELLGLWQCKLRYRTQEEVLTVAREYKKRGIPLDVIVIDFFHWIRQGDWDFDPLYWPDPKAMVDELKAMGTRCMVSVWPTVDRKSVHYDEMREKGYLIRTEKGSPQCFDFLGDTVIYDATNPGAREYIWDKMKETYYKYGIDMFWLDEAEPEFVQYHFDQFRYYLGTDLQVGNIYPRLHSKAFYDGMIKEGRKDIVNLLRCAWVGSQKYASLVWSGDVQSNFESLRDQFAAGLNIGIAGIPWWVSDTGGFFGDKNDKGFNEMLIRWFQFSTFCPVLRMHGDRGPHDIEPLDERDHGGGFCFTGQPNEIWSYGEEVYNILKKFLDIRFSMKEYLKKIMRQASENGSPLLRTMFFEFPNDEMTWELNEPYMFGSDYLVAPVLYEGQRKKKVYIPKGKWRYIYDDTLTEIESGMFIEVDAPIDIIPVWEKMI